MARQNGSTSLISCARYGMQARPHPTPCTLVWRDDLIVTALSLVPKPARASALAYAIARMRVQTRIGRRIRKKLTVARENLVSMSYINIQLDTVFSVKAFLLLFMFCVHVPNIPRFLELAQLKANQDDDSSVIQYQVCYNIKNRNV